MPHGSGQLAPAGQLLSPLEVVAQHACAESVYVVLSSLKHSEARPLISWTDCWISAIGNYN